MAPSDPPPEGRPADERLPDDTGPIPDGPTPARRDRPGGIFSINEGDLAWSSYVDPGGRPASIRYKALTSEAPDVPPVQYLEYGPGQTDPVHSHATGEFFIVTDGELWLSEAPEPARAASCTFPPTRTMRLKPALRAPATTGWSSPDTLTLARGAVAGVRPRAGSRRGTGWAAEEAGFDGSLWRYAAHCRRPLRRPGPWPGQQPSVCG